MAGLAVAAVGAAGAIGAASISASASKKAAKNSSVADFAQAAALDQQTAINKEQYEHWVDTFLGVERQLGNQAFAADSEKNQNDAAAEAGAMTARTFDDQRDATRRAMEQSGNNPADPAFQSTLASISAQAAPAISSMQYLAKKGVRDDVFNKQMGVAQLGRGIPGQVGASLSSTAAAYGARADRLQANADRTAANTAYAVKPLVDFAQKGVAALWGSPSTTPPAQSGGYGTLGMSDDTARSIGLLKEGGIVDGPMIAALAEDGKPEAVLNNGALKLLGRDKINQLNEMGRRIAARGVVSSRRVSLGEN